jgi:hypothetical protein
MSSSVTERVRCSPGRPLADEEADEEQLSKIGFSICDKIR